MMIDPVVARRAALERRPALYCFDLDDTLVGTLHHAHTTLYPGLARRLKQPLPDASRIQAAHGGRLSQAMEVLFPDVDPAVAVDALRALHAEHPVPAAPGARKIVRTLRRAGLMVAAYSSGDPAIVRSTIAHAFPSHPPDIVWPLAEHGTDKTDPRALAMLVGHAEEHAGRAFAPECVLVVGDAPGDAALAQGFGAQHRGLTTGAADAAELRRVGVAPVAIYDSLAEAMALTTDHGVVALIRDARGRFLMVREARRENPFFGCWAGPHGRCRADDYVEEEAVRRETAEEVGVEVRALEPLHCMAADTKVSTVTFWSARLLEGQPPPHPARPHEVAAVAWVSFDEIAAGLPLYPGTRAFFDRFTAETLEGLKW